MITFLVNEQAGQFLPVLFVMGVLYRFPGDKINKVAKNKVMSVHDNNLRYVQANVKNQIPLYNSYWLI
jgi:hypothetical protein